MASQLAPICGRRLEWKSTALSLVLKNFTIQNHAPSLEEVVNTYVDADKKRKRSQLQPAILIGTLSIRLCGEKIKSYKNQWIATPKTSLFPWVGSKKYSTKDTNKNWTIKENVSLTKIMLQKQKDDTEFQ